MQRLDMSAFLEEFKNEVRDHLQKLNNELVQLEDTENPDLVNSLFRSAHSIKGAARMMGFNSLSRVAHKMEDILGAIRDGQLAPDSDLVDLLFKGTDEIERLLDEGSDVRADAGLLSEMESTLSRGEDGVKEARKKSGKRPEETPASKASGLEEEYLRINATRLNHVLEVATESLLYNLTVEEVARSLKDLARKGERLVDELQQLSIRPIAFDTGGAEKRTGDIVGSARSIQKELVDASLQSNTLARRLKGILYDLYESLLDLRLEKFSVLFAPLPRYVRDMSRAEGKKVRLKLEGEDVEIDRAILRKLQDPLIHLVRNAVDHGIEPPDERKNANKLIFGTVSIKAEQMGRLVHLTIHDDGRGIDVERIRAKAVEKGLVSAEEAKTLSFQEIIGFIFLPGFSTKESVSTLSGRGVGLDVVKKATTEMGGSVTIDSVLGKGTTVTLALPSTLALSQVMLMEAGGQTFGIPVMFVDTALDREDAKDLSDGNQSLVSWKNEVIPATSISEVLGMGQKDGERSLLVLKAGRYKAGYWVRNLVGVEEMAVRTPGPILKVSPLIWGYSILGNGDVLLLLDGQELLDITRRGLLSATRRARPEAGGEEGEEPPTVLLVEDSLTTREVERSILLSAGYNVDIASNGKEALEKIGVKEPDVVVTDIEMPVMNGFELTATMRGNPKYKHIPVIMVTSKSSEEDRMKGLQVGAQAYVTKSEFSQEELLDTIERLIDT